MSDQTIKLTLHLTSGQTINTLTSAPEDLDVEDIARNVAEALNGRPSWRSRGNVAFFSGAVSAIEIDTFGDEGERQDR